MSVSEYADDTVEVEVVEASGEREDGESWLAEQARLVLIEDGS